MKLRRLITRRRLKWAGLAATLLLAATMVASYRYWPSYTWLQMKAGHLSDVGIVSGGCYFGRIEIPIGELPNRPQGWHFYKRHNPSRSRILAWSPAVWLPLYEASGQSWALVLPLWMPLIVFAIPTSILFYRDHKPQPWQCPKCRYDLRGLEGGVCPECGENRE